MRAIRTFTQIPGQDCIRPLRGPELIDALRDRLRARAEADQAVPQSDPTVPLIEDVLGDAALLPDDRATYADFAHQWRDFFASLGMTSAPKPQDLLGHLDDRMGTRGPTPE